MRYESAKDRHGDHFVKVQKDKVSLKYVGFAYCSALGGGISCLKADYAAAGLLTCFMKKLYTLYKILENL